MLFDRRCPVCGNSARLVCSRCVHRFAGPPAISIAGLDQVVALMAYDPYSSRLILAGKNGGRRDLLRWLGEHLAAVVAGAAEAETIDFVTWVPAHPAQRRRRGFDQGEALARTVARGLRLPSRRTLLRRGGSQKGLGRADRLEGPSVNVRRRVSGTVLLVDDVATTGASLERCAASLRAAGATGVIGAVVAACEADRTRLEAASQGRQGRRHGALSALGSPTIYIDSPSGVRPEAT